MKIYNITGIGSNLTGSFSGSLTGTFEGSFSTTATANISGAFNDVSSSLASRISSNEGSVDSLNQASSSYLLNTSDTLVGDLTVTGTITAQEFHTEFISASIIYQSGSTKFGDSLDDTHQYTGSIQITGSLEVDAQVTFKVVEAILFQSPQVFTETFTLPQAYNGMLIGPTTLEGQITVSSGSNLTVI